MFIGENKAVVIEDCIILPQLGWGYDFHGPVMHPVQLNDDIIGKLLDGNPPVKFMYVLNPKNKSQRCLLTLDNYKTPVEELFDIVTEPATQTVQEPIQPVEVKEDKAVVVETPKVEEKAEVKPEPIVEEEVINEESGSDDPIELDTDEADVKEEVEKVAKTNKSKKGSTADTDFKFADSNKTAAKKK